MIEWKDVLPMILSTLGSDSGSHACIFGFLKVLPEEVTEGRKIMLSVSGSYSLVWNGALHGPPTIV